MGKKKKTYRGSDRDQLLRQIREDHGNVPVTQEQFRTLTGQNIYQLKVVGSSKDEEETMPQEHGVEAEVSAAQPPAAEDPVSATPDFEEMLRNASRSTIHTHPERAALENVWRKTQTGLDSVLAQSDSRAEIQKHIVSAAEEAQQRLGQVESQADRLLETARTQAEELLEHARREAETLQAETRQALQEAVELVIQETERTRNEADLLSSQATKEAQEHVRKAKSESEKLLAEAGDKVRRQLQEAGEQAHQTRLQAQQESQGMVENAQSRAAEILREAQEERLQAETNRKHTESEHSERLAKLEAEWEEKNARLEEEADQHLSEMTAEYDRRVSELENQRQVILDQAAVQARDILEEATHAATQAAKRSGEVAKQFDDLGDSLRKNASILVGDINEVHAQLKDDLARHAKKLPRSADEFLVEIPDFVAGNQDERRQDSEK